MGLAKIRFYNFRNLKDGDVIVDSPEVYLIGDNGQGKTNFIEAIYLISYGSSFRMSGTRGLIREGEAEALIEATFVEPPQKEPVRSVTIHLHRRKKKQIRLDRRSVQDRKQLIEFRPCILFGHGDMEFVAGSPENRRRFFNQTISLIDPLFIDLLRQYRHVLRARNLVLGSGNASLLDVYDEQLIEKGV
jgi:DNA replication and repair protein RecF